MQATERYRVISTHLGRAEERYGSGATPLAVAQQVSRAYYSGLYVYQSGDGADIHGKYDAFTASIPGSRVPLSIRVYRKDGAS